jgi:hypothetical protein
MISLEVQLSSVAKALNADINVEAVPISTILKAFNIVITVSHPNSFETLPFGPVTRKRKRFHAPGLP